MALTMRERLEALGLGKNEAAVYLAALELGETPIGPLERRTGLHKQLVYTATQRLQDAGLLTIGEVRGRRRFQAADPSALERRVAERLEAVRDLLPALYATANAWREHDLVRTYRGAPAIRQYYVQAMRAQPEKSPILVTGVGGQRFFEIWREAPGSFERFEELRLERKIPLRLLFFLGANQKSSDLPGIKGRQSLEARIIRDSLQAPIDLVVWHTHVTFLFYGAEPYVLDIMGERTVEAFRAYFEAVWKRGESLPSS